MGKENAQMGKAGGNSQYQQINGMYNNPNGNLVELQVTAAAVGGNKGRTSNRSAGTRIKAWGEVTKTAVVRFRRQVRYAEGATRTGRKRSKVTK